MVKLVISGLVFLALLHFINGEFICEFMPVGQLFTAAWKCVNGTAPSCSSLIPYLSCDIEDNVIGIQFSGHGLQSTFLSVTELSEMIRVYRVALIPNSIGTLTSLTSIDFFGNCLTGTCYSLVISLN